MDTDLRNMYAGLCLAEIIGASHGRHQVVVADAARTAIEAAEALCREIDDRDDRAAALERAAWRPGPGPASVASVPDVTEPPVPASDSGEPPVPVAPAAATEPAAQG
jgi:hypothetical protein